MHSAKLHVGLFIHYSIQQIPYNIIYIGFGAENAKANPFTREIQKLINFLFFIKSYIMGAHSKCLTETVPMSSTTIGFMNN